MSKVDYELLDKLTAWMRERGFTRLTYTRGKSTVTLRLPEGGSARPSLSPRTINSPSLGAFMTGHPLADEPFVETGSAVEAGDIVALLRLGPVLLPVQAPFAGTVRSILPQQGDVVGFGDPLFEIEPTEGRDAD